MISSPTILTTVVVKLLHMVDQLMLRKKVTKIMISHGILQVSEGTCLWKPLIHMNLDVKVLVNQVAKELALNHSRKKKDKSPSLRRSSEERSSGRSRSDRSGSTSQVSPIHRSTKPPVIPEQVGYSDDDGVYENSEREEVYLNTPARDDIYQNTGDISSTNIDSDELYLNMSTPDPTLVNKGPLPTPRIDGGEQYMNLAAKQLHNPEDDPSYLKLKEDGPDELYEPVEPSN